MGGQEQAKGQRAGELVTQEQVQIKQDCSLSQLARHRGPEGSGY